MINVTWFNSYSGTPFDPYNKAGFHCWGIIRDVFERQLGVILNEHGDKSAADLLAAARAMKGEFSKQHWVDVEQHQLKTFDLVLMYGFESVSGKLARTIMHIGVMVDSYQVLHIEKDCEAVCVAITDVSIRHRLASFKRHVSQCQ